MGEVKKAVTDLLANAHSLGVNEHLSAKVDASKGQKDTPVPGIDATSRTARGDGEKIKGKPDKASVGRPEGDAQEHQNKQAKLKENPDHDARQERPSAHANSLKEHGRLIRERITHPQGERPERQGKDKTSQTGERGQSESSTNSSTKSSEKDSRGENSSHSLRSGNNERTYGNGHTHNVSSDEEHGHGHQRSENRGRPDRPQGQSSFGDGVEFLRSAVEQRDLPPELREAVNRVLTTLERNGNALSVDDAKLQKQIEHAFNSLNRATEHASNRAGQANDSVYKSVDKQIGNLERYIERVLTQAGRAFDRAGVPSAPIEEAVQQTFDELTAALNLGKHFDRLEKTGGEVVRRAEAAVWRLLLNEATRGRGDTSGEHGQPVGVQGGRLHPAEILRDLRAGAFLPTQEASNPFPLTGRARVATEMMELMRTLDAVDRFMRQLEAQGGGRGGNGTAANTFGLPGKSATGLEMAALEELLAFLQQPTLPGRAGRNQIEAFVRALGGMFVDAHGQTLLAAPDGTPLKLDKMLWLSTAGGLIGSSFEGELFPVRLSPLIVHGFDAIYSLIGFDGRTLNAPRYAAVQVQVNGSEMEWVFGQKPFTEGWMRALIERLKDSAVPDHNLLGEMLEEALVDSRFHAILLQGTVDEGVAVADSFSVTRLLPEASGQIAFEPA
ncbi:MAG TPA: hypothetical protein VF666_10510 [Pyrinomonadaceae bacterium]